MINTNKNLISTVIHIQNFTNTSPFLNDIFICN